MSRTFDMVSGLKDIAQFEDSRDELNPKTDKVIGPMSEDLKKMYTLMWQARREAIAARMRMPEPDEGVEGVTCQSHAAFLRADLLREMFLCAVRDEHDLWKDGCPAIGVRKGFLIVVSATGKRQSFGGEEVIRIAVKATCADFSAPVFNN